MTLLYRADDFDGFLTAVLETWIHRSPGWAIGTEAGDWFGPEGPCRRVEGTPEAARRIAAGVTDLAGPAAWRAIGEAFRHRDSGKEAVLADFIRLCVRHGRDTLNLLEPAVLETVRRSSAVRAEAHRFLGLTRFQRAEGGWYARIAPDHDVLGMLVPAFERRLHGQDWVLHDEGRGTAWVCQGEGRFVHGFRFEGNLVEAEGLSQTLWRRYFHTIALPNRILPRLQAAKMPQKTWKNLVERPGRLSPR